MKEPYDKLSEYSIILDIYIKKIDNAIKVDKVGFTIAKSIKNGEDKIKTVLLYDLIQKTNGIERDKLIKDNLNIYNLFLNEKKKKLKLKENTI